MRIRSHLDPTLFVIFLHVDASRYDDQFRSLVRSLKRKKGADVGAVFEALTDREHRTKRHELYHYWQGLRLPFLHMYALLSYHEAFVVIKELARITPEWATWHELGLLAPSFERLDLPMYVTYSGAGLIDLGREPLPSLGTDASFTPKDLLECAASLYDFQSSCSLRSQISDVQHFSRWRKHNPGYLKVLDICAGVFGSDLLALRCCMPMINAAFHTSIPERAFVELMVRVGGFAKTEHGSAFLAQSEPCRWPEFFEMLLSQLHYDTEEMVGYQGLAILETRFFRMGASLLGSSWAGEIVHPFLGPNSLAWKQAEESMPGLKHYIDLPGYVADPKAHEFASRAEPPLWIMRIFFEDGESAVYPIGGLIDRKVMLRGALADRTDSEMRGYIIDSISAYSAFRRAANAHLTEAFRTCHHSNCPYFEANYCNCYPLIPERFSECGFPNRIREWVSLERDRANA